MKLLISVRIVLKSLNLSFNLFKGRKQAIRICPKSFNLFLSQCYSPLKTITHQKVFVMECPKNCAKIGHAIFGEVLRYVKENFSENVHLSISLREMHKIPRPDAKKRRKKYASRYRSLNLRLADERGKFFFGNVSFPYQVGQETQRNENFCRQTCGIYNS